MNQFKFYAVLFLLILTSCKESRKNEQPVKSTLQHNTKNIVFVLPEIPAMLTTNEQRTHFLATHYWNNYPFADTTLLNSSFDFEQIWANYINLLLCVDTKTAAESLKKTLKKASESKQVFTQFIEMSEKYLYDPNSPTRREELYIPVLETMIKSKVLTDTEKIRPQNLLKLAMKNRIGQRALNFTFTKQSGQTQTLYSVQAGYTLLLFYEPDCNSCTQAISELQQLETINAYTQNGTLKVLAIYADEEEMEAWKKQLPSMPDKWTVGYDKGMIIKSNNLYDLKASPTMYLLDENKKVLLKDVTTVWIEKFLQEKSKT